MTWLPKEVYEFYKDKEGMEYMPELELRDFYRKFQLPPKIITSSAVKEEVIEYAIKRRCT